jgi:hypothetical protein
VSERAAGEPRAPGSWARLYVLVILALAADIAFLWWLTERYR